MIETISYNGKEYPAFQATGNASRFIQPFALEFCKGKGVDVGCNRKEWSLPNAQPIDLIFDDPYHALNLPDTNYDFIYSSHCLEHLDNWVTALDYWIDCLKKGGVMFLYLPHPAQEYWMPFNNRKHIHSLSPELMVSYFSQNRKIEKFFTGMRDLNHSFTIVAEKG